jgi:hypothetical protein
LRVIHLDLTNDVRVVAAESEQMVQAMRSANKPVEYFTYDDEGHSLFLPANKFHFYAKAEEFFAKHLGGRFEAAGRYRRIRYGEIVASVCWLVLIRTGNFNQLTGLLTDRTRARWQSHIATRGTR